MALDLQSRERTYVRQGWGPGRVQRRGQGYGNTAWSVKKEHDRTQSKPRNVLALPRRRAAPPVELDNSGVGPPNFRQRTTRVIQTTIKWLAMLCAGIVLAPTDLHAQMLTWDDQGFVAFNLGLQAQSRSFTETSTPEIYGENALITVPHSVGGGVLVDLAGGYRVWRNLAVTLGYSRSGDSETSTLAAEIPSPLAFGLHRNASAGTGELNHRESAVHIHALWMIPASDKIEIGVFAGPSFWSIKQDFVSLSTADLQEGPPPFNTVDIRSVAIVEESEGAVGFTIGVDGTYLVTPRYGAGVFIRYAGASADMTTPGGGTLTVDAGGFQLGVGLRVRF